MPRVRPRRIHQPHILSARTDRELWLLGGFLVVLPWGLWLLQLGFGIFGSLTDAVVVPDPLAREVARLRQQTTDLTAEVARRELDLRIDQHAGQLADQQIADLHAVREALYQQVALIQRLLGSSMSADLVERMVMEPLGEDDYSYHVRLNSVAREAVASGVPVVLWVKGQRATKTDDANEEKPLADRIRVPLEQNSKAEDAPEFVGQFLLPQGFSPTSLVLELLPAQGLLSGPRQEMTWDSVLPEDSESGD